MLSLSIALAVAGGGSLGEWTAPKARKVIYIDGEMNQGDLQERIRDLLDTGAVTVPDRGVALRNLRIIARQAQDIGQTFYDLNEEDHQRAVLNLIQRGRAELLILDNLTTLSEGNTSRLSRLLWASVALPHPTTQPPLGSPAPEPAQAIDHADVRRTCEESV